MGSNSTKTDIQAERTRLDHLIYDLARTLESHDAKISEDLYRLTLSVIDDAKTLLDNQSNDLAAHQTMATTLSTVYTQLLLEIATDASPHKLQS